MAASQKPCSTELVWMASTVGRCKPADHRVAALRYGTWLKIRAVEQRAARHERAGLQDGRNDFILTDLNWLLQPLVLNTFAAPLGTRGDDAAHHPRAGSDSDARERPIFGALQIPAMLVGTAAEGISIADLIAYGGAYATRITGGPTIKLSLGRTDATSADPEVRAAYPPLLSSPPLIERSAFQTSQTSAHHTCELTARLAAFIPRACHDDSRVRSELSRHASGDDLGAGLKRGGCTLLSQGRLPAETLSPAELKAHFKKMGFTAQELVAISGKWAAPLQASDISLSKHRIFRRAPAGVTPCELSRGTYTAPLE